jgi:transposase-like protein
MTSSKNGVAAKTLYRLLSFGSYQTVWAMLHRYRNAMVGPGRNRLCGDVEVNETMIGGVKPGKRGRGAQGKVLVAVAVEQTPPKGFGRCRLKVIPNAQSPTLRSFLLDHVEPGSTLITDGLSSYHGAAGSDYAHNPTPVKGSGMKAHELLPGVHRVASLVKRWLLGTHQGSVGEDHLQAYLHEFTFRFNRRRSRARGMLFYRLLQQAVETAPAFFKELVANPKPRGENKPIPPKVRRIAPPSLQVAVPPRPWR